MPVNTLSSSINSAGGALVAGGVFLTLLGILFVPGVFFLGLFVIAIGIIGLAIGHMQ